MLVVACKNPSPDTSSDDFCLDFCFFSNACGAKRDGKTMDIATEMKLKLEKGKKVGNFSLITGNMEKDLEELINGKEESKGKEKDEEENNKEKDDEEKSQKVKNDDDKSEENIEGKKGKEVNDKKKDDEEKSEKVENDDDKSEENIDKDEKNDDEINEEDNDEEENEDDEESDKVAEIEDVEIIKLRSSKPKINERKTLENEKTKENAQKNVNPGKNIQSSEKLKKDGSKEKGRRRKESAEKEEESGEDVISYSSEELDLDEIIRKLKNQLNIEKQRRGRVSS